MADLADAFHIFGEDLAVTLTGDIALAVKSDRTVQRIIRRLMTVPTNAQGSAYPWQPKYGVGLGARIGKKLDIPGIKADVRSQMLLEPTVARDPAPVVIVQELSQGGASISVNYADLSGIPKSFSFSLTPP
jgi:hypothetical protein